MITRKDVEDAKKKYKDSCDNPTWKKDPEYISLSKKFFGLRDTLSSKYNKEASQPLYEKYFDLKSRYENQKQEKVKQIPLKISLLITALHGGTDWGFSGGKDFEMVWVSEDERFVILKKPPGTCWAGIGRPHNYIPASYCLYDLEKVKSSKFMSGFSINIEFLVKEIEGRLSKDKLNELITLAKSKGVYKNES